MNDEIISRLKTGLIVSVQANEGSPLNRPEILAALARTVVLPGVVGLRMNAPENIAAARVAVRLPIIGIHKTYDPQGRVWITPDFAKARSLAEAGADIIALDATERQRPTGESLGELIANIHSQLGLPVMADIACYEEGMAAADMGADLVATTLAGYTRLPYAESHDPPDLALVTRLSPVLSVPLIAEGRYNTPALARQALEAGAHAVVVGSMITRPDLIARSFVQALQGSKQ